MSDMSNLSKNVKNSDELKVLGIDLGTSSSAAALLVNGNVQIVPSDEDIEDQKPFPSVVSFYKDGSCRIGKSALEESLYNPHGTVFNVKRKMGTGEKIKVFGNEFLPQFISALFLLKIKIAAESLLHEKISKAVITVPAYFNDNQRQATRDAGRIAGFDVVQILPEPVAAAVGYGLNKLLGEQKIFVFDIGAGTLDVSIIESDDGVLEVLATDGDTNLGGLNMDEVIEEFLIKEFQKQNKVFPDLDDLGKAHLKKLSESIKLKLSESTSVKIEEDFSTDKIQSNISTLLERETFEKLIEPILKKCQFYIESVLKKTKLTADDIDKVILVGGPTKMPSIINMIKTILKEPQTDIDPSFAVSTGAAIQGAVLAGNENLPVLYQGLTLLNVTPLDLGEKAKDRDGNLTVFQMITKNTPYPTEFTKTFHIKKLFQSEVSISVWQGDFERNPNFIGNVEIGQFKLFPLRIGVANEIEVTYNIDADGILTVSAQEKDGDAYSELTIDKYGKAHVPPPELEQAKEKIKKIKKHYKRDVMSPYEIPIDEYQYQKNPDEKNYQWVCRVLANSKDIIIKHHIVDCKEFLERAEFELFVQTDMQYAFAYIHLTGGPVYPIGIHPSLKTEDDNNKRMLTIILVHELLHAIHPDWGHNKIRPAERRLANLAGYFDALVKMDDLFLSGKMSFCRNNLDESGNKIRIKCS